MYCTISSTMATTRFVCSCPSVRDAFTCSSCSVSVSSLLAIQSLCINTCSSVVQKQRMWEEYAIPGLMITFTLGVLLGINLGMLCIPRFFEPNCSPLPQNYIMKQPMPQQPLNAMRYPSGYTAKQLQQHDFAQPRRSQAPLGANLGRRPNPGTFSY